MGSGEYYLEELEDEPCPLVRALVNLSDDSTLSSLHLSIVHV